ncbi:NAD(P)-dependent alcohol dehydrogenase [Cryptosporangium minutisporangium]|uniref:NAD(P)-dependent alcohol dehydrogenase n=1 Tax=Cryptosporangium minutisporangium TaxID=113569 RepID=A0ABP6T4P3_9ACTN
MDITVAAVTDPSGVFSLLPAQLDEPRADEVLVRLSSVGICATDLHFATFLPTNAVLGHEGAGVVEAVGAGVTELQPGDPVALAFASCGVCKQCRTASPSYCAQFDALNFAGARADGSSALRIDGQPVYGHFLGQSSFATHAVANVRSVVKLPASADLRSAGPFTCGFMTGAGTIVNILRPGPESAVAVFGAGAVGLSSVMAAAASGAQTVIAVDVSPGRLQTAAEVGATHVLDSREGDVVERIRAIVPDGLDGSVDTTGRADVVKAAVASLHTRGTCAVVGVGPSENVEVEWRTLLNGRTVTGVISGSAVPQVLVPQLLAWQEAGRFPVEKLMAQYAFADINEAAAATRRGDVVKAVLTL